MKAFITNYRDRLQEARRAPEAPPHVYPGAAARRGRARRARAPAAPAPAPRRPQPPGAGRCQ